MATSWLVAIAGLCLIISKPLDGLDRKMAPFGIVFQPETVRIASRTEEVFELFMAGMIVLAVTYYTRSDKRVTDRIL